MAAVHLLALLLAVACSGTGAAGRVVLHVGTRQLSSARHARPPSDTFASFAARPVSFSGARGREDLPPASWPRPPDGQGREVACSPSSQSGRSPPCKWRDRSRVGAWHVASRPFPSLPLAPPVRPEWLSHGMFSFVEGLRVIEGGADRASGLRLSERSRAQPKSLQPRPRSLPEAARPSWLSEVLHACSPHSSFACPAFVPSATAFFYCRANASSIPRSLLSSCRSRGASFLRACTSLPSGASPNETLGSPQSLSGSSAALPLARSSGHDDLARHPAAVYAAHSLPECAATQAPRRSLSATSSEHVSHVEDENTERQELRTEGSSGDASEGSSALYASPRVDHRHGAVAEPASRARSVAETEATEGSGNDAETEDGDLSEGEFRSGDTEEEGVDVSFLLKQAEELPREDVENLIQNLQENLPHLFEPVHAKFVKEMHHSLASSAQLRDAQSTASTPSRDTLQISEGVDVSRQQPATSTALAKDSEVEASAESTKADEEEAGHDGDDTSEREQEEAPGVPETQVSDSLFDDLSIYSEQELRLILKLLLQQAEETDREEASHDAAPPPSSGGHPAVRPDMALRPWESDEAEDADLSSAPYTPAVPLEELLRTREPVGDLKDIPRYTLIELLEKLSTFIAALPFDDFLNAPSAFTTEQLRDVVGLALARMQQGTYTAEDSTVVRRIAKWRDRREKYAYFKKRANAESDSSEEVEEARTDTDDAGATEATCTAPHNRRSSASEGAAASGGGENAGVSQQRPVKPHGTRGQTPGETDPLETAFAGLSLSRPSGTLDLDQLSRLSVAMSKGVYGVKTFAPRPKEKAADSQPAEGLGGEAAAEGEEEIDVADLDDSSFDATIGSGGEPSSCDYSEGFLGFADQAEVDGMTPEELTLAGADVCEMGTTTLRKILASEENALYRPRYLKAKADIDALSWRQLRDAYTELSRRARGDEETDIVLGERQIISDGEGGDEEAGAADDAGSPGALGARGKAKRPRKKPKRPGAEGEADTERAGAPGSSLQALTWTFDPDIYTDSTGEGEGERLRRGRAVATAAGGCLRYVAAHMKKPEGPGSMPSNSTPTDPAGLTKLPSPAHALDSKCGVNAEGESSGEHGPSDGPRDDQVSSAAPPVSSSAGEDDDSLAAGSALSLSASAPVVEAKDPEGASAAAVPSEEASISPRVAMRSRSPPPPLSASPGFAAFRSLGLSPRVSAAASACLGFSAAPSAVQRVAIPRVLEFLRNPAGDRPRGAVVIGAQTGSGKTLAYLLPLVHHLKLDEDREKPAGGRATPSGRRAHAANRGEETSSDSSLLSHASAPTSLVPAWEEGFDEDALYDNALRLFDQKEAGRPRALILTPTWELSDQVVRTLKALTASSPLPSLASDPAFAPTESEDQHMRSPTEGLAAPRLSVLGLAGGDSLGLQRQQLRARTRLDVVVGTPPRILKLAEWGLLKLNRLRYLVIDEADAMLLSEGFDAEIKEIVKTLDSGGEQRLQGPAETRRRQGGSGHDPENATRNKGGRTTEAAPREWEKGIARIPVIAAAATVSSRLGRALENLTGGGAAELLEAPGMHVPPDSVRHEMIDVGGRDKLEVLRELLRSHEGIRAARKVLIFTNSIQACRACDFAARDILARKSGSSGKVSSCHGSMPPATRKVQFKRFADGTCKFLVCTDLASRGLDLPAVGAVILFDFPLSPVEYLHRTGRTGRMGAKGLVVSLVTKKDRVLATAIQRALEKGTASLVELSADKADYQKGGRLHFLSQAGGYHAKDRKLSEPYRGPSKARRSGWKPPKPAGWHQERAESMRRRQQKREKERDRWRGKEKRKKEEQRQRSKRGAVIAAAKRKLS
ncbi:DEAD/DEAH box helicase domain-containing protein [Besnoitia besnoiti]|uniref:DEAD/DEAH box helicase domain-containing protein n=1 Tax=Besnoitia besnoiti TaxID=94643 RepID=A0A2A9MD75_BESBE|nr:DEAD/DEAH box helicase domain-containing protein [Besnoitia besnoiti]PFH33330.1 DEAD/DEAH box helicase domain-containing protein [Besnoitia besnoiti]